MTTPSETEEIDDEELNQSTDRHMEYKNNDNTEELMTKSYNEGVFGCSPTYKQLGGVFAIMIILVVVMVLLIKNIHFQLDIVSSSLDTMVLLRITM